MREIKEQLATEEEEGRKVALAAELSARQVKLDQLMEQFAKVTLESAMSGEYKRVSEIRREQQQQGGGFQQPYAHVGTGGGYSGAGRERSAFQEATLEDGGEGSRNQRGFYNNRHNRQRGGGYENFGGGRGAEALPEWARDDTIPSKPRPQERGGRGGGGGGGGFDGGVFTSGTK